MVQQGRVLAAALSERDALDATLVEPILIRLRQRTPSRLRVIGPDRRLVSDTSQLGPRREPKTRDDALDDESLRTSWLYQLGSSLFRLVDYVVSGPRPDIGEEFYSAERPFDGAEVQLALEGQYGAATRVTTGGQRSVTLYSALPIESGGEVVGAVLVSRSTFRILQDLYEVRLEERMRFIKSFAADVSHEFRNPLASIRSAAEMLAEVEDPEERARFARIVESDIARLEKLLSEVREVTLLDGTSDEEDEEPGPVDLNAVLRGVAGRERYRSLELELELSDGKLNVAAGPDRMGRVFENLIDNAADFSKGHVRVSSKANGREAVVRVEDDGPGIPKEHAERVFDRFFSYRADASRRGDHTGLGLAIVKAILERRGGSIRSLASSLGGAAFEVRLRLS